MAVADPPYDPAAAASPRDPRPKARTAPRRLIFDRAARWFVSAGGLLVIASILGILFFILLEVFPLLRPAKVVVERRLPLTSPAGALIVDEHRVLAASLDLGGRVRVVSLDDGEQLAESDLLAARGTDSATPPHLVGVASPGHGRNLVAATSDGHLLVQPIDWSVEFDAEGKRSSHADIAAPIDLAVDPDGRPLGAFAAQVAGAGSVSAVAQVADGTLVFARREASENAITGEVELSEDRFTLGAVPQLSVLALDHEARNLYGGTAAGDLFWWSLADGESAQPQRVSAGSAPITAMTLLIGDRSLVVGQESGALSVWFPVRQANDLFHLTRIRDFPARPAAITQLAASQRNRTFFAEDAAGGLGLYFSTSQRVLWSGPAPVAGVTAMVIAPKGDGAVVAGREQLAALELVNPHPEVSWRSLFGKVWYEGYEKPDLVWQSTGGTDDFESKTSLTPLMVGTLKGTLYSLVLAIPLGVLGAMFASQFLHPRLLAYLKPTVEIMAALPSVVLGFLAGLWLAPILERTFAALLLALVVVPLAVWLSGLAWYRLPLAFRNRYPAGAEVLLYAVVVVIALGACISVSGAFERLAFGGNFQSWLLAGTGLRYDQRNAVVVGLAMGVAVIPIIFAIAEDAFSNVPRNLVAGSLALGANRWQTVTKVVLPTASPGIFSAIMIGFGRAIGETMIVLMATGNTPILDFSPFNGFRTLSANIAVEIPEAPFGGTLYRTLFLAALLLFALTFAINTLADLVRQRLRRKYAQL